MIASRAAFTHTGSPRPARPGQLDQGLAENIAGGVDPEQLSEVSHATAWALLSHVHKTWRLYLLRTWMRRQRDAIARLWRLGEPIATSASAIAGVDAAPTEEDIARTADSILAGAFRGDFAVALERASTFVDVVVLGLRVEAKRMTARALAMADTDSPVVGTTDEIHTLRAQAARLLHTAANLQTTARDLRAGAHLWRRGQLE